MSDKDHKQDDQDDFEVERVRLVLKETKELIRALEGTTASRVTIKMGTFQIEVERREEVMVSRTIAAFTTKELALPDAAVTSGVVPIVAPLVGVFYGAPSPGAKPFVVVGDTVERGQKVCIIEAMKVMNEVTSDYHGVVAEISVRDGDSVQYEQKLLLITIIDDTTS